ncbi:MAG: YggS family pyridoxal phosphate enzyme [Acidobacteria bacterium]|nr:YggS family pyridoxal phosphate enzyme [Acidobacteriota bacterium]MBI3662841.1 YggS family pyridoxal phosphate enzyme [Acidobacteriota bacterium]
MSIAENLAEIRARIARAAARVKRNPDEITLVAVSKTFPAAKIREAYAAGVRHFGENRVQEWEGKFSQVADLDATWRLIGHLQSNKVRRAASLFNAIDSVDSLSLAQKLDRALTECSGGLLRFTESGGLHRSLQTGQLGMGSAAPPARLPILIEVRLSPEVTKSGAHPDDLPALAEAILALPHLDLRGLMTIPPLLNTPEDVRPFFRRLRELRDSLRSHLDSVDGSHLKPDTRHLIPILSMGMSHDFEVAIEEGATQVRLGTALFGERTAH